MGLTMDFNDDPANVEASFRRSAEDVEQIEGELEVRIGHSPLHGVTDDGTGTWYVPLNQSLICKRVEGEQWRVEFSDAENILAVLVTREDLLQRTSRKLSNSSPMNQRRGRNDEAWTEEHKRIRVSCEHW